MAQVIHGTLPYRAYDVPMLLNDKKYWANADLTLEYTVTRDPSAGGDFCDWNVHGYDKVFLYDDDGDQAPLTLFNDAEVKRKVLHHLNEAAIVQQCIEDALNFA
jgi:hypothetical protein